MKTVFVVVGDMGSANELIPAADELIALDARVCWFADPRGKAVQMLINRQIPHELRGPNPDDAPDAILVGTSATAAGLQIAWTRHGHEKHTPVIWLEDLWGTGEREVTRCVAPDTMLTVDDTAAEIALAVRPEVRTVVVGKPSFEYLGQFTPQTPQTRSALRRQCVSTLVDDDFLITFWSGGENEERVRVHLGAFVHACVAVGSRAVLAPRIHPKLPAEAQARLWKQVVASPTRILNAGEVRQEELMLASDAVVADWGCTEGYKSMLLAVPTIVTLFPDDRETRLRIGYQQGWPPHVATEAVWEADSPKRLANLLRFVFKYPVAARIHAMRGREKHRNLLEPGAARRIAQAVLSAM